jgi:hypothetical protein
MPKLSQDASKEEKSKCWEREMGDYKRGNLHSGTGKRQVKSRAQAKAIAGSVCATSRRGRKNSRRVNRG